MYSEEKPVIQEKKNLNFMIHQKLLKKYDEQFNFFFGRATHIITFNRQHHPTNIQFRDVSIYAEEQQFMRREYRYKNSSSGKNQMFDRLRILKDYYGEALVMKYEYPMMLLTNNEPTFRRRLRRLKRNVAADASSDDDSENCSFNFDSFSTHGFLNFEDTRRYREHDFGPQLQMRSFDSSVHDIYEQNEEEISPFPQGLSPSKESDLQHLICDVRDVDYDKTLEAYQIIQQKSTDQCKTVDNSNLNKLLKKQGASITPKPLKPRIVEGSFDPRDLRSKTNNHRIQKAGGGSSYLTQKEGLRQKKQKIRDKAAALLHRVKSHNYIDYSKYLSQKTEVEPETKTIIK